MVDHLGHLLCYFGYGWAAKQFCKRQLKQIRLRDEWWILIFCLGIFCISVLCDRLHVPYLITAVLHHGFVSLLILAGFQGGSGKKLLVSAVVLLIKELAGHFANSFFSCLALVLLLFFHKGATGIGSVPDQIIGYASFGVVIVLLWFIKERLSSVFTGRPDKWYRMLSLPLWFLLFIIDVINWGASNGIMVVSYRGIGRLWGSYQNQLFSHGAICLLTLLCFVLAGSLVLGISRIDMEQKKQEQHRMQTSFYKILMEQYEKSERLRHDLKNHVLCLQGLWEDRDWERMGDYLGKMKSAGDLGWEQLTGSRVVDALLYHKKKQAEQRGIEWECDMSVFSQVKIRDFDLCVLLGNLLDNALEAAAVMPKESMPFVQIQAQKVKKYYILVVRNSTERESIFDLEEGIGLSNVRTVVDLYGGVIHRQLEASVFVVSVLLPEKRPDMSGK